MGQFGSLLQRKLLTDVQSPAASSVPEWGQGWVGGAMQEYKSRRGEAQAGGLVPIWRTGRL